MLPGNGSLRIRSPRRESNGLPKGLQQTDLLLAAARAYEKQIDTHDSADFTAAWQKLEDFRQANAEYDKANFAGLTGSEEKWHPKNPTR